MPPLAVLGPGRARLGPPGGTGWPHVGGRGGVVPAVLGRVLVLAAPAHQVGRFRGRGTGDRADAPDLFHRLAGGRGDQFLAATLDRAFQRRQELSPAQARQEYRDWAGQQHVRSENPNRYGLGMDDVEYLAALARAARPAAERKAGP